VYPGRKLFYRRIPLRIVLAEEDYVAERFDIIEPPDPPPQFFRGVQRNLPLRVFSKGPLELLRAYLCDVGPLGLMGRLRKPALREGIANLSAEAGPDVLIAITEFPATSSPWQGIASYWSTYR